MFAFFAEWLFLLLGVCFLGMSFYFNDIKHYGRSTLFFVASIFSVGYFYWSDVQQLVLEKGTIYTALYLITGYVLLGVLTAFIYWIFYNWKAKEKFDEYMAKQSVPLNFKDETPEFTEALRRYLVLRAYCAEIFDDHNNVLGLHVKSIDGINRVGNAPKYIPTVEQLNALVNELLPPRFKACKPFIVGASISWPITLLWLLFSRVIKQLIERIVSVFSSTFDRLSGLTFGKF